jgi:aquaporin Z
LRSGSNNAMEKAPARYLAEFLGTFFLTFAVGCNTLTNSYVWGATSNACTLMVLIYAFGDVSGAHFNPAVSIACFVSMRLSFGELMVYMLVQLFGAALGCMTYSLLFYQSFNIAPMLGFQWYQAAIAELCFTMMLCFVVLSTVFPARQSPQETPPQFAPLAIGMVLVAGAHGAGAISGGCFNPAIALAVDISSAGLGFGWSIAYIGYEFMGAALASVFYRICRPQEFGKDDPVLKKGASGQSVLLSHITSEFLGTFLLTVTVGLNVLSGSRCGAWSIGAALMCMIYALGDVSGAHFNPAVTLAIVASGRYESDVPNPTKGGFYMIAQFLAGIAGAWMFALMFKWETFSLGPVGEYNWATRSIVEVFFTFVLCLTVLSVAVTKVKKVQDEFFGIAIGFTISVGGYVIGTVSGGTMNPAVTLGVATTGTLCAKCMSVFTSCAYILMEFAAGLLAAFVFSLCRPEEYGPGKTLVEGSRVIQSGQPGRTLNAAGRGPP